MGCSSVGSKSGSARLIASLSIASPMNPQQQAPAPHPTRSAQGPRPAPAQAIRPELEVEREKGSETGTNKGGHFTRDACISASFGIRTPDAARRGRTWNDTATGNWWKMGMATVQKQAAARRGEALVRLPGRTASFAFRRRGSRSRRAFLHSTQGLRLRRSSSRIHRSSWPRCMRSFRTFSTIASTWFAVTLTPPRVLTRVEPFDFLYAPQAHVCDGREVCPPFGDMRESVPIRNFEG